jgi:hypothetical protein
MPRHAYKPGAGSITAQIGHENSQTYIVASVTSLCSGVIHCINQNYKTQLAWQLLNTFNILQHGRNINF